MYLLINKFTKYENINIEYLSNAIKKLRKH
jgi:hypothetical protein